jgi:hypothetical protein
VNFPVLIFFKNVKQFQSPIPGISIVLLTPQHHRISSEMYGTMCPLWAVLSSKARRGMLEEKCPASADAEESRRMSVMVSLR